MLKLAKEQIGKMENQRIKRLDKQRNSFGKPSLK
jgi:hypothetical protein